MHVNKKSKILILAANPKNTPPLRLDEEVRELVEALSRSGQRDAFQIEQRWAPRIRDIRRALLDVEPRIVHFSGHGAREGLIFQDAAGAAVVADPKALTDLFALFRDQIECIILNACYSDSQARAISKHIKHVIGMNKDIGDKAAIEFAIGFYDAIGARRSIEVAFKFGTNAMDLIGKSGHLTPVLHSRSENGIDVAAAKTSVPAERETEMQVTELFYSYSYRDERLRLELEKQLSLLGRQGLIHDWDNRKISAGAEWKNAIDEHINTAGIILLLISADFLASDYCYDVEMKRAMERHESGEARVIPVILRPCDWQTAPFGKLLALPRDGKPITAWGSRDEGFLNVAEGVRSAVEDLNH